MGDISHGSVSSLPGSCHGLPEGAVCDNHPDRPAIRRVQGETDSLGCEYHDECAECVEETRKWAKLACIGECDWCKKQATDLRPRRDYEEGMAGPVYEVCGACVKRENEMLQEEAREFGYDDYYYEGPDDDGSEEDEPPETDVAPNRYVYTRPRRRPALVTCKACRKPWAPDHRCRKESR